MNYFILLVIYFVKVTQWTQLVCGLEEQNKIVKTFHQRYVIGALLPVHRSKGKCDIINENYPGLSQVIEALYYAVDRINSNDQILPNVLLEMEIKDYCDEVNTGATQLLKLLEKTSIWHENTTTKFSTCPKNATDSLLIGVILPEDENLFRKAANILETFRIPHLSYSYPYKERLRETYIESGFYFLDQQQIYFESVASGSLFVIEAIFEILHVHDWKYVSLIHSNFSALNREVGARFENLAILREICVENVIKIVDIDRKYDKKKLWDLLPSYDTVDVIVCCYCGDDDLLILQSSVEEVDANRTKRFLVIAGNGKPVRGVYKSFDVLAISLRQQVDKQFDSYYLSHNLRNNLTNPWITELWEDYFLCRFDLDAFPKDSAHTYHKCTGNETLPRFYQQDWNVPFVIKAVYILAHGLHDMLKSQNIVPFNYRKYMRYVDRVNFTYEDEEVSFTFYEPISVRLDISKSEELSPGKYGFVKVGEYSKTSTIYSWTDEKNAVATPTVDGKLIMNRSLVFSTSIKHSCSEPCSNGYAKVMRNNSKCCWDCHLCPPLEILGNVTLCQKCNEGFMSNINKSQCIPIPTINPEWNHVQNITSMLFSVFCVILVAFTLSIFIKYGDTPAVKSTTKELSYMMFAGMVLANVTPFVSVLPPDKLTSLSIRVIPAISFAMIYGSLLVKTNRIARLLAMSKKKFPKRNLKFLSLTAQVIIATILILVEVIICLISLYIHPPGTITKYKQKDDLYYGLVMFDLDENILIETFSFITFLIVCCTYYAFKTRNLPENFNEAKCIGFAMYATILTGISFGFVYFGTDQKVLALNLGVSICSLVVLVFLFTPKLYIVLCRPKRNTRANFSTTSGIRSHIGNSERTTSSKLSCISDDKKNEENQATTTSATPNEHILKSIIKVREILENVITTPIPEVDVSSDVSSQFKKTQIQLQKCLKEVDDLRNVCDK